MPRCFTIAGLMFLTTSLHAAEPSTLSKQVQLYKQAYQQAMTDEIGPQLTIKFREQGLSDEQTRANIAHIVSEMSTCQVGLLNGYEKRYADIAFAVTAKGGSLADSNAEIEKQMDSDLANGVISEERLHSMINAGIDYVKACTGKIFSQ